MQVCFSDQALLDLCGSRASLIKYFGQQLARKIATRLSMLAAAPELDLVPTASPIGLTAVDGQGTYSVALVGDHRLFFEVGVQDLSGSSSLQTITITKIAKPILASAKTGARR